MALPLAGSVSIRLRILERVFEQEVRLYLCLEHLQMGLEDLLFARQALDPFLLNDLIADLILVLE